MQNYDILYKQIELLVDKSLPLYTNLSNVSAVLNQMEDINWCGFYLAEDLTLYLGPFQGEVACTTIECGKGVCGTSFKNKETIINTLNLADGDRLIITSSEKKEGLGEVYTVLDEVIYGIKK